MAIHYNSPKEKVEEIEANFADLERHAMKTEDDCDSINRIMHFQNYPSVNNSAIQLSITARQVSITCK